MATSTKISYWQCVNCGIIYTEEDQESFKTYSCPFESEHELEKIDIHIKNCSNYGTPSCKQKDNKGQVTIIGTPESDKTLLCKDCSEYEKKNQLTIEKQKKIEEQLLEWDADFRFHYQKSPPEKLIKSKRKLLEIEAQRMDARRSFRPKNDAYTKLLKLFVDPTRRQIVQAIFFMGIKSINLKTISLSVDICDRGVKNHLDYLENQGILTRSSNTKSENPNEIYYEIDKLKYLEIINKITNGLNYVMASGPTMDANHVKQQLYDLSTLKNTISSINFTPTAYLQKNSLPDYCGIIPLNDNEDNSIGRSNENKILVVDPFISRNHATIRKKKETWMIQNSINTNKTYVNERLLENADVAILRDGDRIQIGGSHFIFRIRDKTTSINT